MAQTEQVANIFLDDLKNNHLYCHRKAGSIPKFCIKIK
jgi:hypothetical protein